VPQKKGRVERLFGTLQSRLPIEFKRHGVSTIDNALQEAKPSKIYIPDFSHPWKSGAFSKFVYESHLTVKGWENLQYSSHNALANVDEILRHF